MIGGEQDYIESIVEMQFKAQTQGYGDQFPNAMYFIIEKHHEPIGKAIIDFGHNEVRLIDIAFIPQARGLVKRWFSLFRAQRRNAVCRWC